jgi:hypothetical protein
VRNFLRATPAVPTLGSSVACGMAVYRKLRCDSRTTPQPPLKQLSVPPRAVSPYRLPFASSTEAASFGYSNCEIVTVFPPVVHTQSLPDATPRLVSCILSPGILSWASIVARFPSFLQTTAARPL